MEESEKQHRIQLLGELLKCGSNIHLWKYDEYGNLLETDSDRLVLDTIFQRSGCKAYMLENAPKYTAPLIMGSDLGLIWCAVFDHTGDHPFLYVLGPVFHAEISLKTIRQSAKEYHVDLSWREGYVNLLSSLPVVSSILFFQHALTAHYLITGQIRNRSDLHFQIWQSEGHKTADAPEKDRMRVWLAERALLSMIREGDLNYKDAMNQANMLSNGIRSENGNPLLHAMISCTGFTSLCVREAIQSGISPETAYSVGDKYIQSMTEATNVSELIALNHAMYEDFIMRVHKHRTNPRTSPQVQACRDYIELHADQDLSLTVLSQHVGYSEYHLSRKFKQEMGVSIRTYIRYAKVERAKYLLETTHDSIARIAEQLRFCSGSHFSTTFQEVVGQKPQQYRLQHQKI
ncbi:MAG: AraC family transcriptional regulator [Faecousia sp.]